MVAADSEGRFSGARSGLQYVCVSKVAGINSLNKLFVATYACFSRALRYVYKLCLSPSVSSVSPTHPHTHILSHTHSHCVSISISLSHTGLQYVRVSKVVSINSLNKLFDATYVCFSRSLRYVYKLCLSPSLSVSLSHTHTLSHTHLHTVSPSLPRYLWLSLSLLSLSLFTSPYLPLFL